MKRRSGRTYRVNLQGSRISLPRKERGAGGYEIALLIVDREDGGDSFVRNVGSHTIPEDGNIYMADIRYMCKICVVKTERNRFFGRPSCGREDNIKMYWVG